LARWHRATTTYRITSLVQVAWIGELGRKSASTKLGMGGKGDEQQRENCYYQEQSATSHKTSSDFKIAVYIDDHDIVN
jgi:hypothetical protein